MIESESSGIAGTLFFRHYVTKIEMMCIYKWIIKNNCTEGNNYGKDIFTEKHILLR